MRSHKVYATYKNQQKSNVLRSEKKFIEPPFLLSQIANHQTPISISRKQLYIIFIL